MRKLALVSFTAAGERGLCTLKAEDEEEIASLVAAWLPRGVDATRVEVKWVKWSPTALVGEFWWEGPEQTMRKSQMNAFDRVLRLASRVGLGTFPDREAEEILADAEAITKVDKWIKRQKKARNWDEEVKDDA